MKLFSLFILLFCGGCCFFGDKNTQSDSQFDGRQFEEFSLPEEYGRLVSMAENGDSRSIGKLISYYSFSNKTDLRNLKYWSEKQYLLNKNPSAFTNYVLRLSDNELCSEAWDIIDNKFTNRKEFSFYEADNKGYEYIEKKCKRKI